MFSTKMKPRRTLARICHTPVESVSACSRRREEADSAGICKSPPPHVGGYEVCEISRLAVTLAAMCLAGSILRAQTAPPAKPGEHAAAGKQAEDQLENDWVDGRWNQTDVGPCLASSLKTPAGLVAKALSIRVGNTGEAAVCYHTGTPSLRASWTGGFLKYDPARFSLIRPPTTAGEWNFVASGNPGWQGVTARHAALHLNGKRVVLDTRVGETLVRETPWFESAGGASAFTRTIEVGPGKAALTLRLFEEAQASASIEKRHGLEIVTVKHYGKLTVIAQRAGSGAKLSTSEGIIDLAFAPRTKPQRVKLFLWSGAVEDLGAFEKIAAASPAPEDLEKLSRPGPARWLPALTTQGQVGFPKDGFAVDTLTLPYANPWKALLFCTGVDFFRDGSAAVCTIQGDVWRVSGIDEPLRALTWKRYATGLFQPLGLRVVDEKVYVIGRDQITILHDENGDGEADCFENFFNFIGTQPGHDYVTCLERDPVGHFYFVDPRGVHRISPDGRTNETLATGLRNPNGLGLGPGGVLTVTPQQGNWTPSSAIVEVKRGAFYGFGGPQVTPERPLGYDAPLCWLPHTIDNSGSSQVWVPEGRWGALGGQMLHFSWGRCAMMLVLRDAMGGPAQGAAVVLPARFLSGPMRGTFRPQDGQLYVACSTGWQTSATKDGALQRVRYTGAPVGLPIAWRACQNGLTLTFAQPLDPATATDPGSFGVRQWNYRYSKEYGSKDYSVANPEQEGHDEVEVRSAKVLADGRTVFLEMPDLKPVMQMEVKYNLSFASGKTASGPLYLTLNRLADAFVFPPAKP